MKSWLKTLFTPNNNESIASSAPSERSFPKSPDFKSSMHTTKSTPNLQSFGVSKDRREFVDSYPVVDGVALRDTGESQVEFCGLENAGNTCFVNCVLQCLFFCGSFRSKLASVQDINLNTQDNMLACLISLFGAMQIGSDSRKKRSQVDRHLNRLVRQLRKENELLRSPDHHDAHEFFIFVVNSLIDVESRTNNSRRRTWVHEVFEGVMSWETTCLSCESVSEVQETFFDLSVDLSPTIDMCLSKLFTRELMRSSNKYFCDHCGCLQEAERALRLKHLPLVLVIHLKRFKFDETHSSFRRLPHRVEFPQYFSTSQIAGPQRDEKFPPDFRLCGVAVHVGRSMSHGHYIACVRNAGRWLLFDDEEVKEVSWSQLEAFYGDDTDAVRCGYILFYERLVL